MRCSFSATLKDFPHNISSLVEVNSSSHAYVIDCILCLCKACAHVFDACTAIDGEARVVDVGDGVLDDDAFAAEKEDVFGCHVFDDWL